ncbi:unnamed protein product [Nippostrongylus brasiliensis]|uniref:L-type lectin-like domain-containing protein n=1 Tax=Nippostrongylus brasiliensis TaxID=27835 RepID=A0A0N4XN50_NIPBR|nr:unnamed protein product [Nippostrongylus brasiliensis]
MGVLVLSLSIVVVSIADGFKPLNLSGVHVDEVRGHELRELSLTSPYVSGISFELLGNAYVSPNQIHLTENKPSEAGAVWSKSGVKAVDWEIMFTGSYVYAPLFVFVIVIEGYRTHHERREIASRRYGDLVHGHE